MEKLIPRIERIAKKIADNESKRLMLSGFLRKISADASLKDKVQPADISGRKVAAVDGGLLKKSLHAFDCILIRSAGVCFHYESGRVSKVEYYPSKMPQAMPEIFESLSDMDLVGYSHILRMGSELQTAIDVIEKFSPDMLLFDGPLVPHYTLRPNKASPLYPAYNALINSAKSLLSKSKDCLIAGIVEDSRSSEFCEIIRKDILSQVSHPKVEEIKSLLEKTRDTNLLYLFLDKGEMTSVFECVSKESPIFKEIEQAKNLYTFYIKTSSMDRPLKVDFMHKQNAGRIASLLIPISGHHPSYGFPAPLIEADNVAKLGEDEMDRFYSELTSRVGNLPSIMRLRREVRPF